MAKRRKKKGFIGEVMGFTSGVMVTGLGASVVTQAGYSAAPLTQLSRFYPITGKAMGVGIALKHLKKLGG